MFYKKTVENNYITYKIKGINFNYFLFEIDRESVKILIENEDKKVYFILNIKEENPNIKSEKNGNIKFSCSKSLFFKAIGEINLAKLRRERDGSMFTEDSFGYF